MVSVREPLGLLYLCRFPWSAWPSPMLVFVVAYIFCRFGHPRSGVALAHAHASQAPRFSRRLVSCSARVWFFLDVTCLVLHYPRSLRPKHRHSVAGWYPAVRVFPFPSSGATFSGAPSFVLCVPLHRRFLPSGLVTVVPRITPTRGQSSIINHEVWVGL